MVTLYYITFHTQITSSSELYTLIFLFIGTLRIIDIDNTFMHQSAWNAQKHINHPKVTINKNNSYEQQAL